MVQSNRGSRSPGPLALGFFIFIIDNFDWELRVFFEIFAD